MTRAALFDLDGTLIRVATSHLYVKYQRAIGEATLVDQLRMSWWATQYGLGIIDAPRVAEIALARLRGTSAVALAARCDDWARRFVMPHVSDGARLALERHRAAGDLLVMVTGSTSYASEPVARMLRMDHVVATELETEGDTFTGRVKPPINYGKAKIEKTRALADRLGFEPQDAIFYSDSHTDLPLLEHVREAVAVNPDRRLRRIARQKGWRVETW